MANTTEDENHTTIQEFFCQVSLNGVPQMISISALNILLSITAFLGNILIIVALQKVSSIHPPSKLLLGCLAITDLCVGLITQPLFVSYLMSPQHSKRCYYFEKLVETIGKMLGIVSMLTMTSISVDRLLALLLRLRYRQVVTLLRVRIFIVIFWLSSTASVMLAFYDSRLTLAVVCVGLLLCLTTSTVCYTKIYLKLRHHQAQVQDHVSQAQPNQLSGRGNALNIARYKKTVSSALCVQVTLMACYIPYGIVTAVLAITGSRTPPIDLAWDIALSLLLFNSTLNPVLYFWKMRDVRQAVKTTIRQFCSVL